MQITWVTAMQKFMYGAYPLGKELITSLLRNLRMRKRVDDLSQVTVLQVMKPSLEPRESET
jgi:hypothetical protein